MSHEQNTNFRRLRYKEKWNRKSNPGRKTPLRHCINKNTRLILICRVKKATKPRIQDVPPTMRILLYAPVYYTTSISRPYFSLKIAQGGLFCEEGESNSQTCRMDIIFPTTILHIPSKHEYNNIWVLHKIFCLLNIKGNTLVLILM